MRQNNNQQQNSYLRIEPRLQEIQQAPFSQKVLQLEVELRNSEKHYQCTKKPIKFFPKFKRSLHESNNSENHSQIGIFSQKVIPPNIGPNFRSSQNSSKSQNVKFKNVYEAYKQALQQKYQKRMRDFEKSLLKINVQKTQETQSAGQQLIYERQDEIKKRLSNKKMNPSIISDLQRLSISNRQQAVMKNFNPKKNTSFLLETLQNSGYSFVNSLQKKINGKKYQAEYCDTLLSPTQQKGNLYQIKRKCYTQEQLTDDQKYQDKNYNKTRNISFRLPSERKKPHKHFIQKIGGITYNLPQILDKIYTNDSNSTISYQVKSLRKPSKSQNSKVQQRVTTSPLQDFQKIKQKLVKNQRKLINHKNHTQQIDRSEDNFISESFDGCNKIQTSNNRQATIKKSLKYDQNQYKNSRKNAKMNALGDLEGWIVENQHYQQDNTFFTENILENNLKTNELQ